MKCLSTTRFRSKIPFLSRNIPKIGVSRIYWLLTLAFVLLVSCGETNPSVKALKQQGYAFSTESFLKAPVAGDVAAIDLFLKGGMNGNAVLEATGKTALHLGAENGKN